MLTSSPEYLLRGYSADHRIVYGTGGVVPTIDLAAAAETIMARADVAYVHIRSARNGCFQARIERS